MKYEYLETKKAGLCPSTANFDLVADQLVDLELKIQSERKVAQIRSFKQI